VSPGTSAAAAAGGPGARPRVAAACLNDARLAICLVAFHSLYLTRNGGSRERECVCEQVRVCVCVCVYVYVCVHSCVHVTTRTGGSTSSGGGGGYTQLHAPLELNLARLKQVDVVRLVDGPLELGVLPPLQVRSSVLLDLHTTLTMSQELQSE
jgi:hypothetical protein